MGIHFTSGETNLQEHKMCNRRQFGIAIHGQRYVQNITLGPDQNQRRWSYLQTLLSIDPWKHQITSFPTTSGQRHTVESGYQAHALIGITVKQYALHNQVRQILGVEG